MNIIGTRLDLSPLTLGSAGRCGMIHQHGADLDRKAVPDDPALPEKTRPTGAGLLV